MAVTNKYSLFGAQLNTTVPIFIGGISSHGAEPNSAVDREITNDYYAKWYGISGQAPSFSFTTFHLATALTNIGLTGLKLSTLVTGLELWYQKHLNESTREATLKHRKLLAKAGLVVPRRLTVSHGPGQHASVTYEVIITYVSPNDPIIITDDLTLPTAEADDERFALGPWQIGGKTLAHFRSLEIDFGINVVAESADGDIWPTFCSIESITPTITARGIDPEWFKSTNIPLAGLACTHADTIGYLRKREIAGGFVLAAEHIKFTAAGLAHIVQAGEASGQGATETSLAIPLIGDGTNAPLTINTASAI